MRGVSLRTREAARASAAPRLAALGPAAKGVAQELFDLVDALDSSPSLERALTDPSRTSEARRALMIDLLTRAGAQEATRAIAAEMAGGEWFRSGDISDGLEYLGVDAAFAAANASGALETVRGELFQVSIFLMENEDLASALSNPSGTFAERLILIDRLLASRINPVTLLLVGRAVHSRHGQHAVPALQDLTARAAACGEKLLATAVVGVPLSDSQVDRLAALLSRQYGANVYVDQVVDRRVLGGVRVEVGNDVIDATMLARLTQARRETATR